MKYITNLRRHYQSNSLNHLFIGPYRSFVLEKSLFSGLTNKVSYCLQIIGRMGLVCSIAACTVQDKDMAVQVPPENYSSPSTPDMFFTNTMNAAPFLPSNTDTTLAIKLASVSASNQKKYASSEQADYSNYEWEKRIEHNWSFFNMPASQGRVLVIDIKDKNSMPAYRYLANASSQNDLYEPWSSSKIFAYTGAIAKLRNDYPTVLTNFDKISRFGEHHVADLITSINSYESFGLANGNSNAIATFFANVATREFLTGLFYEQWLKLTTPNIYFRGAYGPVAFAPKQTRFDTQNTNIHQTFTVVKEAALDPGYLPYRCENCGLTGNKPMTTLAQAEWLKRLAMHSKDPAFAHPFLQQSDVDTLFYGTGHSKNDNSFAGMTLGVSTMLQKALARNLLALAQNQSNDAGYPTELAPKDILSSPISAKNAKQILDDYSDGKWRVFQKIGWGPSETRSTSENVVLAYVYLPSANPAQNNKVFIVAAQVAVPEAKEENVALAGLKMEALLSNSMSQYLRID